MSISKKRLKEIEAIQDEEIAGDSCCCTSEAMFFHHYEDA